MLLELVNGDMLMNEDGNYTSTYSGHNNGNTNANAIHANDAPSPPPVLQHKAYNTAQQQQGKKQQTRQQHDLKHDSSTKDSLCRNEHENEPEHDLDNKHGPMVWSDLVSTNNNRLMPVCSG